MYREAQQSVETSDTAYNDAEGDLFINQLIYAMPKALSVRTQKTHLMMYPQRQTYEVSPSNTIIFTWNTGNSYIDLDNSFLKFRMVAKGVSVVTPPTFGVYGSGLNLFNQVRLKTKSGVEVARDEQCNLFNNYRLQYTKSSNWIDTLGATFYLNSPTSPFNSANTLQTEICIPLTELCTFFRPLKSGQLLPPQLASGCQVELQLEKLAKCFKDTASFFGVGATLELADISMMLSAVSLSDEISKVVNLESSQSGLEWTYERYHSYNSILPAGTSSVNAQISKAVSQSNHVMSIISNNTTINLATADSFISEAWKCKAWQYRLGSAYYPQQTLQDNLTSAVKGASSYLLAMNSFDKMKANSQKDTSVTLSEFAGNLGIQAVSLQRDESLMVSGQPINNSRMLELILERDGTADGTDKVEVNIFMSYISVCKAFIDNASVAI